MQICTTSIKCFCSVCLETEALSSQPLPALHDMDTGENEEAFDGVPAEEENQEANVRRRKTKKSQECDDEKQEG